MKIKIKEFIEAREISINELLKATDIDYATIFRIVNRKSGSIKFSNLDKICAALECELADILELEKVEIMDKLNNIR